MRIYIFTYTYFCFYKKSLYIFLVKKSTMLTDIIKEYCKNKKKQFKSDNDDNEEQSDGNDVDATSATLSDRQQTCVCHHKEKNHNVDEGDHYHCRRSSNRNIIISDDKFNSIYLTLATFCVCLFIIIIICFLSYANRITTTSSGDSLLHSLRTDNMVREELREMVRSTILDMKSTADIPSFSER